MLDELEQLERELHQRSVRDDIARLAVLLHESFMEVGRSGNTYRLKDILNDLPQKQGAHEVWSDHYKLQYESDNAALLTYKSAHIHQDGSLSSFSLRSSLWVREDKQWKMLYHQATPTVPFDANTI